MSDIWTAWNFADWVRYRWSRYDDRDTNRDIAIMGLGIGGEFAEVVQAVGAVQEQIKKHIRDGKHPDTEALKYELGDVIHYAVRIGQVFGISFDEILTANVAKLEARSRGERVG